jgi:hypothetical protein
MSSAKIGDYSDREILAAMADLNGDGDVRAQDLATRLLGAEEKHEIRCVTSRLAWMRRFGLVEKGEQKGEWTISNEGVALGFAKLPRAIDTHIAGAPVTASLELAHVVGERMVRSRDVVRTAMRREFQWQIRRKR